MLVRDHRVRDAVPVVVATPISFDGSVPPPLPPTITVTPDTGLVQGQPVTVTGANFAPELVRRARRVHGRRRRRSGTARGAVRCVESDDDGAFTTTFACVGARSTSATSRRASSTAPSAPLLCSVVASGVERWGARGAADRLRPVGAASHARRHRHPAVRTPRPRGSSHVHSSGFAPGERVVVSQCPAGAPLAGIVQRLLLTVELPRRRRERRGPDLAARAPRADDERRCRHHPRHDELRRLGRRLRRPDPVGRRPARAHRRPARVRPDGGGAAAGGRHRPARSVHRRSAGRGPRRPATRRTRSSGSPSARRAWSPAATRATRVPTGCSPSSAPRPTAPSPARSRSTRRCRAPTVRSTAARRVRACCSRPTATTTAPSGPRCRSPSPPASTCWAHRRRAALAFTGAGGATVPTAVIGFGLLLVGGALVLLARKRAAG